MKSNAVCEQVIKAAASLISAAEVPLNQLLHFISTIPRECTDYFGTYVREMENVLSATSTLILSFLENNYTSYLCFHYHLILCFTLLLYILVGPLRVIVQEWFAQKKERSAGNTLLEKLIDFPTIYVKHTEVDGLYLFDDEDVGAWEAEARRWARTLLLVTSEEQHFKQIFMVCFAWQPVF